MECTVLIDDRLLEAGRQAAGTSEVQTLVEVGLRELVRSQQLKVLADSFGTFDLDLTVEELRRLRRAEVDRLERLEQDHQ